jgi:L-ascorbate metabolism protein UlaG (beta-lactamase superfamily)
MSSDEHMLFLRANCVVEPLIDRWYAWPHLVAPATAARNLTERHLRIMASYLSDPEAHAEAAANPALAGGPFMRYATDCSAQIVALRDQTCRDRAALIELSGALAELDAILDQQARGLALEPLYAGLPAPLGGCVELGYDLRNRPSYRLVEPLLYRRYNLASAQSLRLSLVANDDRAFIFSTPRLDDDYSLHWQIPFAAEQVEALFAARANPTSCDALVDLLNAHGHETLLRQMLTGEAPPPARRFEGPGMRWRYFGHACVLVETRTCAVLTDPVFSYPFAHASRRFTTADLPPFIDFVVLTHTHQDHVLLEALLQLRSQIGMIVVPRNSNGAVQDPSLRLILQACGFKHVIDLAEFDELCSGDIRLQAIPFFGEHCDLAITSKSAWLIRAGNNSILCAADSRNLSPALYREVHEVTGDIGTLFVGMECDGAPLSWIYGPLLTNRIDRAVDQSRRANASDCAGALALIEALRCRQVYVYAMGQEPWLDFISSIHYGPESNPIVQSDELVRLLRARGLTAERLFGCAEQVLPER